MHTLSSRILDVSPFLVLNCVLTWTGPCISYGASKKREEQLAPSKKMRALHSAIA
jgi:hypothetical protein